MDDRVVREYVGAGPLADLAAEMDRLERLERAEEAEARREERDHLDALEGPVDELCEAAEVLARAALVLSGYRRHNRGEWRRRRDV